MEMRLCETTAIVIERNGSYLLAQRRYPPEKGSWGFPGGHIEKDESAWQCAVRECSEEVGKTTVEKKHFYEFTHDWEFGHRHHVYVFRGNMIGEPIAGTDAQAVQWVRLEKMKTLRLANFTVEILNFLQFGKR